MSHGIDSAADSGPSTARIFIGTMAFAVVVVVLTIAVPWTLYTWLFAPF